MLQFVNSNHEVHTVTSWTRDLLFSHCKDCLVGYIIPTGPFVSDPPIVLQWEKVCPLACDIEFDMCIYYITLCVLGI